MSESAVKASMPTAMEWQARCTVGAAKNLAHWVKKTQGERLGWRASAGPESKTRSIFDQMEECVRINRRMARWLKGDQTELAPGPTLDTAEVIERELLSSAEELAEAIRGLSAEDIDREFDTAWGKMIGRELIIVPMANMYYHGGQVNYIQTLYGDTDFHFPE